MTIKITSSTQIKSLAQRARARYFFLTVAALSPLAGAADKPVPTPVAVDPMNMILGVLFLLVMVAAGWWLVKRAGGLQLNQGAAIRVIAATAVGPRERVVLIELAGEQWLLGVAPGQVNLLHRFEEPVVAANSDDFGSKIRQLMQQGFGK